MGCRYATQYELLHHIRQLQIEASLCSLDPARLASLETRVQAAAEEGKASKDRARAHAATSRAPSLTRSFSGVNAAEVAEMVSQVSMAWVRATGPRQWP